VYTGADRVCPACSTAGSAAVKFCGECGHPLDGAAEVKRIAEKAGAPPKKTGRKPLFIALGVVALIIGLFALLGLKKNVSLEVTDHSWKREIAVEQFTQVRESKWCDEMPADAYDVSRRRETRSHRDVPDGETCRTERTDNGDGTFSEKDVCTTKYRSEPVDDDKCEYTARRWKTVRTAEASGGRNDPLSWPQVTIAGGGEQLGAEREGPRKEICTIHYVDPEKKQYACVFPEAKWRAIAPGSRWNGKANNVTGNLDCESMTPAK
jgi:hypothetical protein